MKKCVFLLCLMFLTACQKHSDTTVLDSHGNKISLNHLDGKWLVVNYWATWCENCKKDMRDLDDFYRTKKDQVIVLGVNFDGLPAEKLNDIQRKMHLSYSLASDFPIKKFGVDNIENLPRTYIFSPDGILRQTLYGPQTPLMLTQAINYTKTG